MNNLIEFYTKTLHSVNLITNDEGYILTPTAKNPTMVMVNKKPLVLPLKHQIDNMTEIVDGEVNVIKTIFNPLKEDAVKGESDSLKKLKNIIEIKLSYSIGTVFELLLRLGADLDLQKNASLDVTSFIGTLKEVRGQNIKKTIDEGSLERWSKIVAPLVKGTTSKGLVHIFLKKGGVHNDTKYNRLSVLSFPLYKIMNELGKTDPLNGVKLRGKDLKVFKLIYEYIFTNINSPENYMIGSNDATSPGFIGLMKTYVNIAGRLNELLNNLKFVDSETAEIGMLDIHLTHKDLDSTAMYANELAVIPSDLDANRANNRLLGNKLPVPNAGQVVTQAQEPNTTGKADARAILNGNLNNQANLNLPVPTAPVTPALDTSNLTPAQKILYGNNPSAATMHGGHITKPMGVNNMTQMHNPANLPLPNQGGYGAQLPVGNSYSMPYNQQNNMQSRPIGINSMTR